MPETCCCAKGPPGRPGLLCSSRCRAFAFFREFVPAACLQTTLLFLSYSFMPSFSSLVSFLLSLSISLARAVFVLSIFSRTDFWHLLTCFLLLFLSFVGCIQLYFYKFIVYVLYFLILPSQDYKFGVHFISQVLKSSIFTIWF